MTSTCVLPTTKNAALRMLGVADPRLRERLAGMIDFVSFPADRTIVGPRSPLPLVYVGLSGAIRLQHPDGLSTVVRAPFVLDLWVDDAVRPTGSRVVVESPVSALLVDWTVREAVLDRVPHMSALSRDTERRLRWRMPTDQASSAAAAY